MSVPALVSLTAGLLLGGIAPAYATGAGTATTTSTAATPDEALTHHVYVVVAAPKGKACDEPMCGFTTAEIERSIATLSDFWSSGSDGKVTFALADANGDAAGQIATMTTDQGCDMGGTVAQTAEAGTMVTRTLGWTDHDYLYYFGNSAQAPAEGNHLVVLNAPGACTLGEAGFYGHGSPGSTLHAGGIFYSNQGVTDTLTPEGTPDLLGQTTIIHELGHNLGLAHANVLYCTDGRLDVDVTGLGGGSVIDDRCSIPAYGDKSDVMGNGYTGDSASHRLFGPLALSSPGRVLSGMFEEGSDYTRLMSSANSGAVTATRTYQLRALTDAGGTRTLVVKDSSNGDVYYVEYRNGTGWDAKALYRATDDPYVFTDNGASDVGITLTGGVRIVKSGVGGETVLLPAGTAGGNRATGMAAGQTFTTRSGEVTFTVKALSGDDATVSVTMPSDIETWTADATYGAGDLVTYDGRVYEAQWYAHEEVPGSTAYGAWAEQGAPTTCSTGTRPAWTASVTYTGGEIVVHDGKVWQAKWWTRHQEPGDLYGPWAEQGSC